MLFISDFTLKLDNNLILEQFPSSILSEYLFGCKWAKAPLLNSSNAKRMTSLVLNLSYIR